MYLTLPKKIFRLKHFLSRRNRAMSYYKDNLRLINRWAEKQTEFSNYYYALEDSNLKDLAGLISLIFDLDYYKVMAFIDEINSDLPLKNHIKKFYSLNSGYRDSTSEYARRVGWYAVARIIKPKIIVETGVSQGMGSCILSLALLKNSQEGFNGQYFGTDIDPNAGALYDTPYSDFGRILYGDSISSLKTLSFEIDLFINDSNHDSEYEYHEYEAIKPLLTSRTIILGDNSHISQSLREWSLLNDRKYVFFKEVPKEHWYPGAGIGISFSQTRL